MNKNENPSSCLTLIGMAGCGKTTIARALSEELGWPSLDSDHLIEALYARRLQDVTDAMSREEFLAVEAGMICSLKINRAIIATGGSVPYSAKAMEHLRTLGPVVWLDAPLELIEKRIAEKPDRGLVIAPGQTIGDLLEERKPLYRREATHVCPCGEMTPQEISAWIRENVLD